jgi:predicted neuraminidase
VECPNGDLLVCWYRGSGERRADDVLVEGARKRAGAAGFAEPFVLADAPGFPDTNPCLFIDPAGRLWLFWQTILANEWHTALARYKVSRNYQQEGPPEWSHADDLLLRPGPEFARMIEQHHLRQEALAADLPEELRGRALAYLAERRRRAADKFFSRLGWMTRVHPLAASGNRLLIPLYSDGFDLSLVALSDDQGATWRASAPIVSLGGVQPSLVERKDGTLVAFMRDNGPPPKRVISSESKDRGETWSIGVDTEIPNPGSSVEVVALRSGNWLLVANDLEQGRHRLTAMLSDDEGASWKWRRPIEASAADAPEGITASYPSVIQTGDGLIHVTYTHTLKPASAPRDPEGRPLRECIKHAWFSERWIQQPAHGPADAAALR